MSFYTFRLDQFRITQTRSKFNDTDVVAIGWTVGNTESWQLTRQMGDRNNDLYALLFSRQLAHPPRGFVRTECTGKRICNPGSSAMTARQMKEFEP